MACSPISSSYPPVARDFTRSLVAAGCLSSLRIVDVLRGRFIEAAPDREGNPVIAIETAWTKDGAPMWTYSPAIGFLGPLEWWPEHFAAFAGKPFMLEAFDAPRGKSNKILSAEKPLGYVLHERLPWSCVKELLSLPPLSLSPVELERSKISGHSFHGSPSDIARSIGSGNPIFNFSTKQDVRELGHWKRFCHRPPSQDEEASNPRASAHSTSAAERDGSREMDLHYTSGDGRSGHRTAHLRVRTRLVRAVQEAIRIQGGDWTSLPLDNESMLAHLHGV